jgi:hypothetical protein
METGSGYQSWLASALMELLFLQALFLKDFMAISGTLGWREFTRETPIFATSSPTGWSNDEIGLAWLIQVFDRYTKRKAGRS